MSLVLVLWSLVLVAGLLLAVSMVARVNREQRSPAGTMAWLLLIVFLPYVGVPLYLVIGGRKMRRLAGRKAHLRPEPHEGRLLADLPQMDRVFRHLELPGVTTGNKVKLSRTGQEMFGDLVGLIEQAEKTIHLTTYKLGWDEVGREIVRRLAARAAQGVQVRLNLDGIGSRWLPRRLLRPLTEAGGKVAFFMPVLRLPFQTRTHLRNHRKMVVVDDRLVMAGGANLAREYLGPVPDPARWRDLCFVLEGPAVQDYAALFRADWAFASGEVLEPAPALETDAAGDAAGAMVQVIPSGPDVPGDYLYDALVYSIFAARERLWLATPYFIPDETLLKALRIAALRGMDVLLVVPQRSNYWIADVAGRQALREIQRAGGRVLLYPAGMMHAKVMIVDDFMAVIGSANLDMRSLFFNYEVVMFMYSRPEIQATEEWLTSLHVVPRTLEEEISELRHFGEGLVRMAAPLL
ncbi:MAG: cardiolipin synthase [Thermodesulfobacteriota bacterium]